MPEVMAPTRGFFIDGQWSTSASVVDIHSPYDQKVVGSVAMAGEADVERAIAASVRAFDVTRKLAAYERQRVLKLGETAPRAGVVLPADPRPRRGLAAVLAARHAI